VSVPDEAFALQIADLADVGLLRLDTARVIRSANAAAHRHLGRPANSLVGRTALEAFLDHRVSQLLDDAGQRGELIEREIGLGGEPQRTLSLNVVPASLGEWTWIVVRDLSELRRLQRIRAEFVDNLSHELRTPLTNVRLLTETLAIEIDRAQDVPSGIRDAVGRIDVETGHLVQMVNELLDLARIEGGDARMRRETVDLGEVVLNVVERLRPYADRQAVTFRVELRPEPAERTVLGDEERLGQLLVNLLHNAVKFSPADAEVVVRVKSEPLANELVLEVEDHGPGIPRRDLERIFERFYKVDRARTRGGPGGTGLGLSIARHIADAHGGRIWVESEEARGARFLVSLPRG
jgi:two-component system phosphate regulon sensor histidine kinase PhoR